MRGPDIQAKPGSAREIPARTRFSFGGSALVLALSISLGGCSGDGPGPDDGGDDGSAATLSKTDAPTSGVSVKSCADDVAFRVCAEAVLRDLSHASDQNQPLGGDEAFRVLSSRCSLESAPPPSTFAPNFEAARQAVRQSCW